MVIAIAANSKDPETIVGSRFCTAKYFHIIDSETHEIKIVENKQLDRDMQDVEQNAADIIIDKGVGVVLAGQCGPNAFNALSSAGIQVVAAVDNTIRDAAGEYCFWDDDNEYALNAEPWWNWK